MAFLADPVDQVDHPVDVGTGEIDGEEHHLEPLIVGVVGGLDRQIDGALEIPAVAVLDKMAGSPALP